VPVARIGKTSIKLDCLHFTQKSVSNYQLHVPYSKQHYVTVYGNATNWNSTGHWEEIDGEPCTFRVKF
jgi:hypothetical protein